MNRPYRDDEEMQARECMRLLIDSAIELKGHYPRETLAILKEDAIPAIEKLLEMAENNDVEDRR